MSFFDSLGDFQAPNRAAWRAWLEEHHASERGIFLVYYKKASGIPSIIYREALEEALCFGWIDSTIRPIDGQRYRQVFTPRNPSSKWSKVNRGLIEALTARGLMHPSGLRAVALAKEKGTWDILKDCEDHILPDDLASALGPLRPAFDALSANEKIGWLWHLKEAKRPETRAKRLQKILDALAPKQNI